MSVDRKLFGTNELVDNFIKGLHLVEKTDGGWTSRYIDSLSGDEWVRYLAEDRIFLFNLMRTNPNVTTEELLDIAFTSAYPDEVNAAARRLYIEEQSETKSYRGNLIARLKSSASKQLDQKERERLKAIIQAGQLLDRTNRREILGKHYKEIEADAKFYQDAADEAEAIMALLNQQNNTLA